MNQREDIDLSEVLKPIREVRPSDMQIKQWHLAIKRELNQDSDLNVRERNKLLLQLTAAMFVGLVLGASLMRMIAPANSHSIEVAQIAVDSATFEHSHTNLD